ncbi:MAG: hypothetical protein K8U03_25860 [Planctomycetia bacterium]|nr:hypothetical protein [Planctomycetia bacterium]
MPCRCLARCCWSSPVRRSGNWPGKVIDLGGAVQIGGDQRPHQGCENELLVRPQGTKKLTALDETTFPLRNVRCRKRLGGLLKHYERIAA